MGKMKEQLGDLPFGTEEDGVVSMMESDYLAMEREIEAMQDAIELLRHRMNKIVLDNFLDEVYDMEEEGCVCDKCITKFKLEEGGRQ